MMNNDHFNFRRKRERKRERGNIIDLIQKTFLRWTFLYCHRTANAVVESLKIEEGNQSMSALILVPSAVGCVVVVVGGSLIKLAAMA